MANDMGTLQFGIRYNVDTSGLDKVKNQLQELQNMNYKTFAAQTGQTGKQQEILQSLNKVKETASQVEQAMKKAFNPTLGGYNINVLNKELKSIGLDKIAKDFNSMGAQGKAMFSQLAAQATQLNTQLRQSHKILDDFATSMGNTIKWGITSSIMNSFTGSVQQAYGYIKNLDSSLNDIRIVTGKSAEEMDAFAVKANKAAQALGSSTLNYTKAALIYAQQGLDDEEIEARANITLKTANVTGQTGDAVSEQLTAVWNGYKVSAQEAELYVDKMAAVAATTASDLQELSTGMQKVASAANLMGVDIDQLNAQLATVISTTRQAPETVGTAFKTIYARMSTINAGGTDEDGATLTSYTKKMDKFGISVLDTNGKLRDMGEVIEEIGDKWGQFTREQQISLAQVAAGTRQYGNLTALFDNWDKYKETLKVSASAAGTLNEQNSIYLESMTAHINQLQTANDNLMDSLFNADSFKGWIDAGTEGLKFLTNFVDAIGGGGNAFLALGSIATQVFSKNIASGISTALSNLTSFASNAKALTEQLDVVRDFAISNGANNQTTNDVINYRRTENTYSNVMTEEERSAYDERIKKLAEMGGAADQAAEAEARLKVQLEELSRMSLKDTDFKDVSNGFLDAGKIEEAIASVRQNVEEAKNSLKSFDDISKNVVKETTVGQFKESFKNIDIDNVKKSLEKLGQVYSKDSKELEDYTKKVEKYIEALKKQQEILNKAESNGHTGKQLHNAKADQTNVKEVYKETADAAKEMSEAVEQAQNQAEGAVQKLEEQSEESFHTIQEDARNTSRNYEEAKEALDKINEGLAQRAIIKSVVDTAGALGTLSSSILSFKNLGSIWHQSDVDTGTKILQTIQSLAFAIPSAVGAIGKLNKVYQTMQGLQKVNLTLEGQSLTITKAQITEIGKETFVKAQSVNVEESSNAVKKIATTLSIDEATARKLVTEETNRQVIQQNALNTQMLASPIFWMVAAIAVAVTAINNWTEAEKEKLKVQKENNDKVLEEYKNTQQQAEENKKLYETYKSLEEQYKKQELSKNDLLSQTSDIIDAYDIENGKIYALTGNYEALTKAIDEARRAELESNIADAQKAQKAAGSNLEVKSKQDSHKDWLSDVVIYHSGSQTSSTESDQFTDIVNRALQGESKFLNSRIDIDTMGRDGDKKKYTPTISFDSSSAESIYGAYEEAQKVIKEAESQGLSIDNAPALKALYDFLNDYKDVAEEYKSTTNDILNAQKEQAAYSSGIFKADSYEDFTQRVEKMKTSLKELGLTEKEADKAAEDYIAKMSDEYAIRYKALTKLQEKFKDSASIKSLLSELSNEDLSILLSVGVNGEETSEQLKAIINAAKKDLSEDDLSVTFSVREKIEKGEGKVTAKDLEDLRTGEYADKLVDFESKSRLEQLDILDEIDNEIIKNRAEYYEDLLSEDKEASTQVLEELEGLQKQIAQQLKDNSFYSTYSGTNEFLPEKRSNKNALNPYIDNDQLNFEAINKRKQELLQKQALQNQNLTHSEKLELQLLNDEFSTVEELEKAYEKLREEKIKAHASDEGQEYDALISESEYVEQKIHDIENDLNNFSVTDAFEGMSDIYAKELDQMIGKTQTLVDLAGKIGEGYKVQAKDFQSMVDMYPELLEGATAAANGEIQLNEEVVKKWFEGKRDQAKAELDAATAKIDNENTFLELQNEYDKQRLQGIQDYLDGKISESELEKEIEAAAQEFRDNLTKKDLENKINGISVLDKALQAQGMAPFEYIDNLGVAIDEIARKMASALAGEETQEIHSKDIAAEGFKNFDADKYLQSFKPNTAEFYMHEYGNYGQRRKYTEEAVALGKQIQESINERNRIIDQNNKNKTVAEANYNIYDSAYNSLGQQKNKSSGSVQKTDYDNQKADPFLVIDGQIKQAKTNIETLQSQIKEAETKNDWEQVHTLQESLDEQLKVLIKFYQDKKALVEQDIEDNKNLISSLGGTGIINEDGTVNNEIYKSALDQLNQNAADKAAEWDNLKNNGGTAEQIAEAKLAYDNAKDDVKAFAEAVKAYIKDSTETLPGLSKEIQNAVKLEDFGKIDKYKEIDYEIKKINNDLSKLQKIQKGLSGEDLQKNLKQQIELIDKRNKKLTEKKSGKVAERDLLQSQLVNQFGHEGFQVNEDGSTTYAKVLEHFQSQYNEYVRLAKEAIEAGDEALAAAYKEQANTIIAEKNAFMELFGQWTGILSDIDDIDDQLEDTVQQKVDAQIAAFDAKIKLKLDLADAKRQWLEFKHEMTKVKWDIWGNDILDEARYNIEKFWTYPDSINTMLGGLNQITSSINTMKDGKTDSIFGDYTQGMEKAVSMSKEYRDKIMSDLKEAGATIEDIERAYLDMIDRASQTLGDHIKQFELINEIFEHNRKMITLTQGDKAYDKLAKYYDLQVKNNNAQIASLKEQADMWERRMNAATYGSEEWVKLRDQWEDTVSQLNSTIESSVENLIAKYENGVDLILQNFEKSLTGGSQLDDLQTEWDRLNQEADVYLDKINSAYEIEKLKNKYLDSIDNAKNDVAAQERLTKVMNEQVAALKEKDKLTQYDVDRANLLYEIELKKIALEESQANKSKMRLRRDSQGNYSYQYVGDDKNDDKRQELEDLQNRLYNMDKDQFIKNQNDILKLQQDYKKELAEIAKDATLTEEEKQKKILSLNEHYGKMINALDTENAVIKKNLNESTMSELISLYGYTEDTAKNILMEEIVPQWDSGVQQMIDKMVADGGFGPSVEDTFNKISALQAQYQTELKSVADAAGISLDQLKNGYDGVWEAVQGIIDQSQGIEDAMDRQLDLAKQLADQAEILRQAWLEVAAAAEAAFKANDDAQQKNQKDLDSQITQSISQSIESIASAALNAPPKTTNAADTIKDNSTNSNKSSSSSIKYWKIQEGQPYYNDPVGMSQKGTFTKEQVGKKYTIDESKPNNQNYVYLKELQAYVRRSMLQSLDTGGYTGEWGTEGRLAMLHQKELVLNAKDTENILNVVDIVRQMMNQVQNMNNSINSIGVQSSASTGQLEQNVHIEATFPNVSNANEVQSALENLVNTASQYAFRTGR